ncbi:MAG: hypothetical protein NWE83_11495 [Candidatus Bathyarchaeota archaeon]|nr:hypothetical protein [Candidatus Bathyarchaeota archaeon]
MPYVNNHGVNIHYQVEGQRPDLVLLHGFTSTLRARVHPNGKDKESTRIRLT